MSDLSVLYEAIEKHEKEKVRLEEKLEICEIILQSLYATKAAQGTNP